MIARPPRSIVPATWLIGLGIVLLVQQATRLSWDRAWPMFVILLGVASFVSIVVHRRPGLGDLWAFTWPIAWIAVGSILLASTTATLDQGPGELVGQWWPVGAMALGAWFLVGAFVSGTAARSETLAVPLAARSSASIRVRFGAGTLTVSKAAREHLVDGSFEGGVVVREDRPGDFTLSPDTDIDLPWLDRGFQWALGLSGQVPLQLRFDIGAARTSLDLSDLIARRVELHTGASETNLRLPRSAGSTDVRIEAGAAAVTIEVPTGLAARIRSQMVLGETKVDDGRFPRIGDVYQSADYETSANRADIEVRGGVGSVRIVSVA